MTTTPMPREAVAQAAARFCKPKPTPEREPVRHWFKVRELMATGPKSYRDVAAALLLNPWHANTLIRRLAWAGLIEVHQRGLKGSRRRATTYRIKQ
jgi:hypothetical protein